MVATLRQYNRLCRADGHGYHSRWWPDPGGHLEQSVPEWLGPAYRFQFGTFHAARQHSLAVRLLPQEYPELPLEFWFPARAHAGSADRGELRRPARPEPDHQLVIF